MPSTVFLRLNEGALGKDRFGPDFVIPHDWAKFAATAFVFWRTNPALLQVASAQVNRPRLLTLADDENPLIAVRAASVLAQAFLLDADFGRGPLARAKGLRQAAFVSLVLAQFPFGDALSPANASVASALNSVVDEAKDAGVLKSFVIGADSAAYLPFYNEDYNGARFGVLRHVEARQKVLLARSGEGDFVASALPLLGY